MDDFLVSMIFLKIIEKKYLLWDWTFPEDMPIPYIYKSVMLDDYQLYKEKF